MNRFSFFIFFRLFSVSRILQLYRNNALYLLLCLVICPSHICTSDYGCSMKWFMGCPARYQGQYYRHSAVILVCSTGVRFDSTTRGTTATLPVISISLLTKPFFSFSPFDSIKRSCLFANSPSTNSLGL